MNATVLLKGYGKLLLAAPYNRFALLVLVLLASLPALGQTTATWNGGVGEWAPCPQGGGNALWNTCGNSPPVYPSGNYNVVIPTQNGPVTLITSAASIVNISIGTGDNLEIAGGYLDITGNSIANNGTITIASGDGLGLIGQGQTVTLSGSGLVNMTSPTANFHGTAGSSPLLINQQTIQGQGSLGIEGFSITNQGIIDAIGATLTVQTSTAGITNTGLMEASSGATLWIVAPVTNTGGTIEALSGGTVTLDGNVSGGKLTTAGTGVIQATQDSILNGVTNSGSLQVSSNAALLQGTTTNTGTIQVQQSGTLYMSGNVTLAGSGALILKNPSLMEQNVTSVGIPGGSLTNQQLVHGSGTIYDLPLTNQATIEADDPSNPLYVETAVTNTGTLEASGGASLVIYPGQTVNNTGGTVEAQTGSNVLLEGTVSGGTLATSGSGVIESENGTLDGTVNVPTNTGLLTIVGSDNLVMQGTINNTGTIVMTSGAGCIEVLQPTTLTGSGILSMGAGNCIYGSGIPFTNQSTIEGAGTIGDSNPMPITNNGTILANNKNAVLTITPNSAGFTNNGTLTAKKSCTLKINGGPFNNLSGGTLTAGAYNIAGTLDVGSAISTNSASITLMGAPAQIYNTYNGINALATLVANAATGVLSLQSGQVLTTSTSLSNAGTMTIAAKSGLTTGGSYTQTAGTTTVDGTLTAPSGLIAQGGTLLGKGAFVGAVTNLATVTAGDSATKPGVLTVTGSYTQSSSGALNVPVNGDTIGSQYSQLAVSNGVSLGGTLNIQRKKSFKPAVGATFTILTGSAITGQFSTVNGTSISSGEHFELTYTPTAVTLTVASGG